MIRVLVSVSVVLSTLFLGHGVTAIRTPMPPVPPDVAQPEQDASRPRVDFDPDQMAEDILSSGLFPSSGSNGAGPGDHAQTAVPATPIEAAKKVTLVGTVLSDRTNTLAIIQHNATKRQHVYRLHAVVPDVGRLADIQRDGVLFVSGSQREWLELPAAKLRKLPEPLGGPPDRPGAPIVVDRQALLNDWTDPTKLRSQVLEEPVQSEGEVTGWRIAAYKTDSLFGKLRLKPGDVVREVNGTPAPDAAAFLALMADAREDDEFSITVLRNNEGVALHYVIR